MYSNEECKVLHPNMCNVRTRDTKSDSYSRPRKRLAFIEKVTLNLGAMKAFERWLNVEPYI